MSTWAVARNQRGALTQAGAGIAASRLARWSISRGHCCLRAHLRHVPSGDVRGHIMFKLSLGRLAIPLALVLLVSGCALRSPSIAELKYNPGKYQDHNVSVQGVVTSSWGVPLVPFRLYKIDDGTGEMTVLANNGRV